MTDVDWDKNGIDIEEEEEEDEFDSLFNVDNAFGQEAYLEEVEPDELDFYPSQVTSGLKETQEKVEAHTSESPELSSEDIDAYWQGANTDGSETSGGSSPTPDQDRVEDIAEPWGLRYESDEEINLEKKIEDQEKDREQNEGFGGL